MKCYKEVEESTLDGDGDKTTKIIKHVVVDTVDDSELS